LKLARKKSGPRRLSMVSSWVDAFLIPSFGSRA